MRRSRSAAGGATVWVGLAALSVAGCHRSSGEGQASAPAEEAVADRAPDAEVALAPARCKRTDQAFVLASADALDELELGDAVSYPGGIAVGLVHRTGAGRVGAVAMLARAPLKLTRIVDLGPTLGDAPPPRVGWRSPDLVAATYARQPTIKSGPAAGAASAPSGSTARSGMAGPGPAQGDDRDVALYAITGDTGATLGAPRVVPQRRDDSLALDLAFSGPSGLLVWDEATSAASGPRGVIKAAAFAKDHVAIAHDISPAESDAELPRVAAAGPGFVVVWIARLPEATVTDGSESEATGEARAFGWLEMVSLDDRGIAIGAVRRLTHPGGHVSAFDLEARPAEPPAEEAEGAGTPTLLVVARDDGEAVDGSGGTLLRVRVKGDTVEAPVAFETDGLGRGAPSFVSDLAPTNGARTLALAWVGRDEDARFLPLDRAGSPTAPPSGEGALKDARPLLFLDRLGGSPADGSSILVASPSDSDAQLRVFACAK